jgi:hypothetical protein
MTTLVVTRRTASDAGVRGRSSFRWTLAAAVLGFFVITLDAVVVNVACLRSARSLVVASPDCSGWWTATSSCLPRC